MRLQVGACTTSLCLKQSTEEPRGGNTEVLCGTTKDVCVIKAHRQVSFVLFLLKNTNSVNHILKTNGLFDIDQILDA